MDEEFRPKPDLQLAGLMMQDISALSVSDLEERIERLRGEIERCEDALDARRSVRNAAESVFKI